MQRAILIIFLMVGMCGAFAQQP
ncbi:MAG: hypothetical protein QOH96_3331, partial [Blastocatellia bacterium]|nr:hypothetical protein [Blastocatellia bacterium]